MRRSLCSVRQAAFFPVFAGLDHDHAVADRPSFFLCLLPLPAVKLPDSFPLLPTLAILYLGVGVTMLSFLLYNFAVRSVPASRTGAFLNLVPVLTLFMGMVFLDERLTAGQWAASALVFGGVILSQWKTAQSEEKADSSATASLSEGAE